MQQKNYYEILNLSSTADIDEVKIAYKKAILVFHDDAPELYSLYSEGEKVTKVASIEEAYSILSNPEKKCAYDAKLKNADIKVAVDRQGMPSFLEGKNRTAKQVGLKVVTNGFDFKTPLEVQNENSSQVIESYRILFTKIEEIKQNKSHNVFAITSPMKGDGKTSTSLNLAYLMSKEFKKKVVLVECDLKHPAISYGLGQKPRKKGLVSLLKGKSKLAKVMAPLEDNKNLYLIPAINTVKNSTVLLSSPNMTELISSLKEEFDYVILDCPPVMPLADMNVISKKVDGVLMVVRAEKTSKDVIKRVFKSLEGVNIVGIVFNGCRSSSKKYSYYY